MTDTATAVANKAVWVDLAAKDAAAERDFYQKVFGWDIQVNPDPQYGGYGLAKVGGKDAAGIGPAQMPEQPSAWTLYIGSNDLEGLSKKVTAAGGKIVAPAFDVGDQGRMAVFQDATGAYISAWQTTQMGGFQSHGDNTFGWAELNARGVEKAIPFYEEVFGWQAHNMDAPGQPYTELHLDGERVAGATEMNPMVPADVPNYWLVYFNVADVDAAHKKAIEAGGRELVAPLDFPGGRMSIVSDPEGAAFGLMKMGQA